MVAFAHRELRAARLMMVLAGGCLGVRWMVWGFSTDQPWWLRGIVGAFVGGTLLAGLPALYQWAKEKESDYTSPKPSDLIHALPVPAVLPIAPNAPTSIEPIIKAPVVEPPAATPEPSIPKPKVEVPTPPPREFVDADVTPEFLVGLYDKQTYLGASTFSLRYKGKWMIVSGPLLDVTGGWPFVENRIPAVAVLDNYPSSASVIMMFSGEWIDRIAMIPKKQNIYVQGQIKEIERSKVVLENCELIESGPMTNQ